ncbi:MAG: hypothetical protein O2925_00485 [Actinomycetota bacterium]|jgi:hypothetical protein|nr:hypothetical protein [Actinomycetota bacterium]MDA3015250.1 hypothetical protein [Actinomycetota bacterium]MDA3027247.1 hypothetical protein [Actinomycetota bacterium]
MRLIGDRGSAVVSSLVVLSVLTVGSVIWMARDVSTTISLRSDATEIAFQAARAGAQGLDVAALRGDEPQVSLDPADAERRVRIAAQTLFDSTGVEGVVTQVSVTGDRVQVAVEVVAPTAVIEGRATVLAVRG